MFQKYKNYIILALVLLAFLIGFKFVLSICSFVLGFFVIDQSLKQAKELEKIEEEIYSFEKEIKDMKESEDEKTRQTVEQTEKELDQWLDKDL